MKWTDEQQAIFDSHDENILVSASAGSGKTTVMIQKIINLVTDKNKRTPISKFLVVTFTKASAADMKKKLVEAFLEHQDDDFCLEQIDDVETSDISNLHSFCSRLISTYFYDVNVDPAFQVLDDTICSFLQEKALDRLFEKKEKSGDSEYFKLYDIFQKKRQNKQLKNIIKKFNNYLNANLDSDKWFFDSLDNIYSLDLSKNLCAKLINWFVPKRISELVRDIENFANVCLDAEMPKHYEYFIDVASKLKAIKSTNPYGVNAKNIQEISFERTPSTKEENPLKLQIKEMKDLIDKQLINFRKNYISDDIEFLKQGLTEMKQVALSLYNLVKEFNEIYDEIKREMNGLDFNDLEKYALKILKNPEILQALKEKYKYVFVDEYQDINSVQEEIISLVSGKNNRFMVGDIKQSIYRFRLCDPDIFMRKYELYSGNDENSKLFKLNCNFRSDKKILRFVDTVFSGVMTEDFGDIDYEKDSKFIPGEENLDKPNSVNMFLIDTTKQKQEQTVPTGVYSVKNHNQTELEDEEKGVNEAKVVANTIKNIINEVGRENFKYSDVAVLVISRNPMVSKFIETLKQYGIKVSGDEKCNLVEKVYIQEILNFVKLACNQNDDILTFKVLKSRLFNFSDDELIQIRLVDPRARFFECVSQFEKFANENLKQKIMHFIQEMQKFSTFARLMNIKQLCKKIIDEFSLYQINDASYEFEKANADIDLMINALPDTDTFDFVINYSNFALEVETESGGDNVTVMTIHKSKGIEFKYVFLINTTNEFNFDSTKENVVFNKKYGVGIDYFDIINRTQIATIASSGIKLLEKRKLVEEEQRVLYVALTRAKERLFVICSKDKNKIMKNYKSNKRCFADWFEPLIFKELNGQHNEEINFQVYNLDDLKDSIEKTDNVVYFKNENEQEPEWFKYKFDDANKFSLKTSISKILKNEDENVEQFIGTGSSAERGTTYHKFLQKIDFKNGNLSSQIDSIYEKEKSKELIDVEKIKKIVKLPIFDEISKAKYILTEREFYSKISTDNFKNNNAKGEFILQGIIDLIAILDDYIIVLDYKTGKYSEEKLQNYLFQLNTYADVTQKIYGKQFCKKVLCFIDEQKIIEI